MAPLKKTFYLALRVIILVGLFIAFILTSAEPSIKNFMRERVTIDVSKVETDQLQSPAVTVCVHTVSDSWINMKILNVIGYKTGGFKKV